MKRILETPHFYLREFIIDDAEPIYQLNLDPEVIKYTGDPPFTSIVEAKKFIEQYDHYQLYGYGRWAVISKPNNEFFGWCGLKYSPSSREIDLGFRFHKKHWNKGYATEVAEACIKYGFDVLGIHTIIGRSMIENSGSIKVLEKIGMEYLREENCGNFPGVVYKIEK